MKIAKIEILFRIIPIPSLPFIVDSRPYRNTENTYCEDDKGKSVLILLVGQVVDYERNMERGSWKNCIATLHRARTRAVISVGIHFFNSPIPSAQQ
jgi:hypothetical protein